jgi:hypothetical protein
MKTTYHLCQSVEGALRNWTRADWLYLAKKNNKTIDECKDHFWDLIKAGKLVVPIGKPCEGFDYKNGCPGHEEQA